MNQFLAAQSHRANDPQPPTEVNSDMIDEGDDKNYDLIQSEYMHKIESQGREITPQLKKKLMCEPLSQLNISDVIEVFNCTICQSTAVEPMVIKHCLHFFCKKCIDKYILN